MGGKGAMQTRKHRTAARGSRNKRVGRLCKDMHVLNTMDGKLKNIQSLHWRGQSDMTQCGEYDGGEAQGDMEHRRGSSLGSCEDDCEEVASTEY